MAALYRCQCMDNAPTDLLCTTTCIQHHTVATKWVNTSLHSASTAAAAALAGHSARKSASVSAGGGIDPTRPSTSAENNTHEATKLLVRIGAMTQRTEDLQRLAQADLPLEQRQQLATQVRRAHERDRAAAGNELRWQSLR